MRGTFEAATAAEAKALSSDLVTITPAKLKEAFNATGDAPFYATRAWMNLNGVTGVARAAGNMTATKTATGKYDISFTTPMPDANYAVNITVGQNDGGAAADLGAAFWYLPTANGFKMFTGDTSANNFQDQLYVGITVTR